MANGDENKPKRKLPPRDPDTGRFVKAQQQKNKLLSDEIQSLEKKAKLVDELIEKERKEIELISEQRKLDEEINSTLGLTGGTLEAINKTFGGILGNTGDIMKKAQEQLKLKRAELHEQGKSLTKMDGLKTLLPLIGKSMKANLLDPAQLLAQAFDYNKQLTDLRKNLGLSYGEAQKLKIQLDAAALSIGRMAIHSKDVMKAFAGLNDELGIASTVIPKQIVQEVAVLEKLMGLSTQAANAFGRESLRTGVATEQIKLDAIGTVKAVEEEYGTRLNIRQVLDESGKVTGQIRAQLGGSLTEIIKAVGAAKELGFELNQVEKTAKHLLNFEESIEAELTAELITGRQLNLEKARLYALTGDYKNLVDEINAQGMDWNEWSTMNVKEQESYAAALGLSADELSDALLAEQDIAKLAQEARDAGNEELAQQLEARNAQEKFNDAVMKLKDAFVSIAGPLSFILEVLAAVLTPIGTMISGFTKLMSLFTGGGEKLSFWEKTLGASLAIWLAIIGAIKIYQGFQKLSLALSAAKATAENSSKLAIMAQRVAEAAALPFKTISALLSGTKAIAEVTAAEALTLGLATIGIVAGLIAVVGAMSASKSKIRPAGDFFSPSQGSGGYGKRAIVAPEGTFALNNNDTVIAGTKLFKSDDTVSTGEGKFNMGIDYDKMANANNRWASNKDFSSKTTFDLWNFKNVNKMGGNNPRNDSLEFIS